MSCNHALSQINSRPRKLRELKLCKLGKSDIGDFIPIDQRTKKPLPLPEWTLRPYIDVAHEIGWITRSGKDVAAVLRDYRNYVHPEKQRSHGIKLQDHDAKMFWDVTRNLVIQLLGIASPTGGRRAV